MSSIKMNESNYGYAFHEFIIHDDVVTKSFKNEIGKWKINKEIKFYRFIEERFINFPIPKLVSWQDGTLSIEYLKNSCTITGVINKENTQMYMMKILECLKPLHAITIPVSIETVRRDVQLEIEKKVLDRFAEFDWETIPCIKSVNGVKIKNIYVYINSIKQRLLKLDRTQYSLIHGDLHLGNILHYDKNKILFIDPRGYFGESELFGLIEYDYAKLLFGLSGYSVFDMMEIDSITLNDDNLDIEFIRNHEYIIDNSFFSDTTLMFFLSIWLSNNSSFLSPNKKIVSLMTAYYYCEKILHFE